MQISRRSGQNMATADSWDMWPLNPGPGVMLAVFRNGYSSVVNGPGSNGPVIFSTDADAEAFAMKTAPGLPRRRRDSGPVNHNPQPNPATALDEAKA